MKYIKKFERLDVEELDRLFNEERHRRLNEMFTQFRDNEPLLKNIWYEFNYTRTSPSLKIIWFWTPNSTKLITRPNEVHKNIFEMSKYKSVWRISNIINNTNFSCDEDDLIETVEKCVSYIKECQDYTNLESKLNFGFTILDYDKFLFEFEKQLSETSSKFLYDSIEKFYILLQNADIDIRQKLERRLTEDYKYIVDSNKYNL